MVLLLKNSPSITVTSRRTIGVNSYFNYTRESVEDEIRDQGSAQLTDFFGRLRSAVPAATKIYGSVARKIMPSRFAARMQSMAAK